MVPGRGHAAVLALPTDTLLFVAMAKSWSSTAGRTHSCFHRRDVLRCLYLRTQNTSRTELQVSTSKTMVHFTDHFTNTILTSGSISMFWFFSIRSKYRTESQKYHICL